MLTPKQERFVAEYLKDLNATQAAVRAGYSAKTAESQGSRLLSNVKVKAAVAEGQAKLAAESGVTVRRVVDELARIAFADIRQLFDENGNLRPVNELPEDIARAVAGVEVTKTRTWTKDEETTSEHVSKVRSWDKPRTLELLAKHLGMLREKVEHSGEVNLPTRVIHEYHTDHAAN